MPTINDKTTITDNGVALITRCLSEAKKLEITRVMAGDIASSSDPRHVVAMAGAIKVTMNLIDVSFDSIDNSTVIQCDIDNQNITVPMTMNEFGIFAKAEGDVADILFAYANTSTSPETLCNGADISQTKEILFRLQTGVMNGTMYKSQMNYSDTNKVSISMFKRIMSGMLGSIQHTLLSTLPDDTGDYGWMDGGEIKKSDYPDLWERVRPNVDTAIANVTSGVWEYLGSSNIKSYYGWYKGTTDEYFRKPNLMDTGAYLRPTNARGTGVFQVQSIQSHTHGASSASAGGHSHTTDSQGGHSHSFYLGGNGGNDNINMPSASDHQYNYQYYTTNTAGAHTHTSTTSGAHTHGITINSYGGVETTPNNIAVRLFALLRIRGV